MLRSDPCRLNIENVRVQACRPLMLPSSEQEHLAGDHRGEQVAATLLFYN